MGAGEVASGYPTERAGVTVPDLNGVSSGRVGAAVWFTRQLTGKPFVTRGYVRTSDRTIPCGHDHRKALRARECAYRLALSAEQPTEDRSPNGPERPAR